MQVSTVMVRALAGVVERAGGKRDQFLAAAGLEPQLIADPNARISLCDYLRTIDAAIEVSADPAFGLHMGEQANSAMFDVLGPLTLHAATLRDGIAIMTRYSRLMAEGYAPQLHELGKHASIRFDALRGDFPAVRLTAEFVMMGLLHTLRQFAGHQARPTRVSFAYPVPRYVEEYNRIFQDPPHFDQPFTELIFPRIWLDPPQLYQSPDLHSVLKTQADRALDRLERGATYTERLELLLASRSPRQLTMDEAARALGSSRRSLNRRLATEGTSYAAVAERARTTAAKRMLENPRISIQETAHALGFSGPAAFHRAFKRWTGMTPSQYRATF